MEWILQRACNEIHITKRRTEGENEKRKKWHRWHFEYSVLWLFRFFFIFIWLACMCCISSYAPTRVKRFSILSFHSYSLCHFAIVFIFFFHFSCTVSFCPMHFPIRPRKCFKHGHNLSYNIFCCFIFFTQAYSRNFSHQTHGHTYNGRQVEHRRKKTDLNAFNSTTHIVVRVERLVQRCEWNDSLRSEQKKIARTRRKW